MTLTQNDLTSINDILTKELQKQLKKELRPIKKDIKDIKATQNLIIGQFDLRLNHLEKHTSHPPHNITTIIATA